CMATSRQSPVLLRARYNEELRAWGEAVQAVWEGRLHAVPSRLRWCPSTTSATLGSPSRRTTCCRRLQAEATPFAKAFPRSNTVISMSVAADPAETMIGYLRHNDLRFTCLAARGAVQTLAAHGESHQDTPAINAVAG